MRNKSVQSKWHGFALRSVLAVALLGPGLLFSQTETRDENAHVRQVIDRFIADIGRRDANAVAKSLTAKATFVIVRKGEAGYQTIYTTGQEWVERMRANPGEPFDEPLSNVQITIDSDALAHVRADFSVIRNGKVLSHGVDQFTLVREEGEWKIALIAFTSIPGAP